MTDRAYSQRTLDAAARVFATHGYHRSTVDDIAVAAGATTESLGETNKYDLFSQAVLRTTRTLVSASDHLTGDVNNARQGRNQLTAIIEASARTTIVQRGASGFYRSEVRNLNPEHRAQNDALVQELQVRTRRPLAAMRPTLNDDEIAILAAAAQSTIASITIHPTDLPEQKMLTLLTTAAMRVLDSAPVRPEDITPGPELHFPWHNDDTPRSRVIRAALHLFAERGFDVVTPDDIAEASGEPTSVVTAEFGSPVGLLFHICQVGHRELQRVDTAVLESASTPRQILIGLCCNYVHHSFAEPDGITTFLNDGRRLEGAERTDLLALQADTVGNWVRALLALRPELSLPEASFLIFAGMCIVNDLGRMVRWEDNELIKARIQKVVLAALAVTPSR